MKDLGRAARRLVVIAIVLTAATVGWPQVAGAGSSNRTAHAVALGSPSKPPYPTPTPLPAAARKPVFGGFKVKPSQTANPPSTKSLIPLIEKFRAQRLQQITASHRSPTRASRTRSRRRLAARILSDTSTQTAATDPAHPKDAARVRRREPE
jgi:hypothetical protein